MKSNEHCNRYQGARGGTLGVELVLADQGSDGQHRSLLPARWCAASFVRSTLSCCWAGAAAAVSSCSASACAPAAAVAASWRGWSRLSLASSLWARAMLTPSPDAGFMPRSPRVRTLPARSRQRPYSPSFRGRLGFNPRSLRSLLYRANSLPVSTSCISSGRSRRCWAFRSNSVCACKQGKGQHEEG